ncbi:4'-phosphopantetheinyl transferase family protein [Curtobacterium sp. NPDC087082]|uniref:4'-phosphopantetheinyl transferase family protein n=1 Tax=Curtobacterium sp. NPDC087082 TaxID=3363966 RepID=UPI00380EAB2B
MSLPRLQTVVVTIRRSGGSPDADREALLTAVASAAGVDVSAVRAGRVCPHCAATDHGRPWAEVDGSAVGVSLARTTDLVALAVGPPGIGVDLERVSRVAAARLDAFTPGELARSGDDTARAACWAVKEAVLKRDGRGLRVDPTRVDVDLGRGTAVLDGVSQPVTVLFPAVDVVLAVAAGGAPVSVGA